MQDVHTLMKVNVVATEIACCILQGECMIELSPNHFKL
jgi:hypothetical protein